MIPSQPETQTPRIIFNIPDGREKVNPSLESLEELVLSRGDDFWAVGSGQGALEFMGPQGGGRLLLTGLESAGFFLIFEPAEGDPLSPINPSATPTDQDNVTVHVGGEPMEVPRQNFLDKETAWRVIGDFLSNGQPSRRIKWEPWL